MKSYTKPVILKKRYTIMRRILLYTAAFVVGWIAGAGVYNVAHGLELDCNDIDFGVYDYTEVSTNRPTRNNNPGNIKKSSRTYFGETDVDSEYESFRTPEQGYAAMFDLLNRRYAGMTLSEALHKYAPVYDGNDTEKYIRFVEKKSGLSRDDFVVNINNHKSIDMVKYMSIYEGMKGFQDEDISLGWIIWSKCYRD